MEDKYSCTECDYWREQYLDLLRMHAEEISKMHHQLGVWKGIKRWFTRRR